MSAEITALAAWAFVSEIPIPEDIRPLLVDGEQPFTAYKTMRDSAVFTNKRLIVRDAQGLTGKKIEVYSLPYSSINMWSSENAGTFDVNAEFELTARVDSHGPRPASGFRPAVDEDDLTHKSTHPTTLLCPPRVVALRQRSDGTGSAVLASHVSPLQ